MGHYTLAITEMQIITTQRLHLTAETMIIIKNSSTKIGYNAVGGRNPSTLLV